MKFGLVIIGSAAALRMKSSSKVEVSTQALAKSQGTLGLESGSYDYNSYNNNSYDYNSYNYNSYDYNSYDYNSYDYSYQPSYSYRRRSQNRYDSYPHVYSFSY